MYTPSNLIFFVFEVESPEKGLLGEIRHCQPACGPNELVIVKDEVPAFFVSEVETVRLKPWYKRKKSFRVMAL